MDFGAHRDVEYDGRSMAAAANMWESGDGGAITTRGHIDNCISQENLYRIRKLWQWSILSYSIAATYSHPSQIILSTRTYP